MSARTRRLRAQFDRYNHILIPKTPAERERFRNSRFAKAMRPLVGLYMALSNGGVVTIPPVPTLIAVVVAALGAVSILTAIPSRLGARRPVAAILQTEAG